MDFSTAPTALPEGFIAQFSAVHNRYFFVDTRTGTSYWEIPEDLKLQPKEEKPFVWARNPVDGTFYKKEYNMPIPVPQNQLYHQIGTYPNQPGYQQGPGNPTMAIQGSAYGASQSQMNDGGYTQPFPKQH